MLRRKILAMMIAMAAVIMFTSCDKDDDPVDNFDTSGNYSQVDQMARPAINTVFVGSARKNEFNTTVPSAMDAAFSAQFQSVLTNFGYTSNALGMDKAAFAAAVWLSSDRAANHCAAYLFLAFADVPVPRHSGNGRIPTPQLNQAALV